jgi:hypothetical protein
MIVARRDARFDARFRAVLTDCQAISMSAGWMRAKAQMTESVISEATSRRAANPCRSLRPG